MHLHDSDFYPCFLAARLCPMLTRENRKEDTHEEAMTMLNTLASRNLVVRDLDATDAALFIRLQRSRDDVTVIDLAANKVGRTKKTGNGPWGIAITAKPAS
jgi:YVTN family beta-propeller protein